MLITVSLKNNKTSTYNLPADITAFKTLVSKAITGNDYARLQSIKTQLEANLDKSAAEIEQLQRISTKLSNALPPPPFIPALAPPIVPVPVPAPAPAPIVPMIMPAPQISDGETQFQELYAHLMLDMASSTHNIQHLIDYSALVVNMFMHAATFTPYDGHGQSQLREFNHKSQLQYYRSQGNHSHATFFKKLVPSATSTAISRLPFNEGFTKLIAQDDFSKTLCAEIKKIDPKTGYPKPGVKVDGYAMTQIAHAGARKNNFSALIQGMKQLINQPGNLNVTLGLQDKLRHILPPTKAVLKLSPQECTARIQAFVDGFHALNHAQPSPIQVDEHLARHLLSYRTARVDAIKQHMQSNPLNHIKIDSNQHNITCLFIRLYPEFKINNDTYKEGVTNVLLSFFGGLLNHYSEQSGLRLHTERRQSFGFLRPTITDAGCLMLRLSLGVEPAAFDNVVLKSLSKLNELLETFKFDQATHDSVKHVFAFEKPLVAKEEGKRKPRDPDTYIRSVVRKDNQTFTTYHQAKAYIKQAASLNAPGDYCEHAMRLFLQNYICGKVELPLPAQALLESKTPVGVIASPVVHILKNTLNYAVDFMNEIGPLAPIDPLIPFSHVYLHSVQKLFNNCTSAQHLLTKIDKMEPSEFYYQALLLIENTLEYLISLDGLRHIRAELQQKPLDSIARLRQQELSYASDCLNIPSNQMKLWFTDSGQQAITSALLTLSVAFHGAAADGKYYDSDVHLFGQTYYEVAEFIKDCKKSNLSLEMTNIKHAKIIFIDVSQINQLPRADCKAMKALVIDITHHPLIDKDDLRHIINNAYQCGIYVILVESSLKHAQLGLDKYQSGKIIVISPPNLALSPVACDLLDNVSRDAIHPAAASYLTMVNAIGREKQASLASLETKGAAAALAQHGLMQKPMPALNEQLQAPLPYNQNPVRLK